MSHKKGNFFCLSHPFWTCQKCLSNCHFVCMTWDFGWFLLVIQWFQHWMMDEWKNSNLFHCFMTVPNEKCAECDVRFAWKGVAECILFIWMDVLQRFEAFFALFCTNFVIWLSFVLFVVNVRIKLFVFVNLTVDISNYSG